jgi:perosamine synthetase
VTQETETRGVPLSSPYTGEREEELVLEVLRSGRLSLGPTIDRFEELFAAAIGAPYAAAVSSGPGCTCSASRPASASATR